MGKSFLGLRHLPLVALTVSLSGVIASCGSDECYDNRNAIPLADLYTASPTPQKISIDSISVWGIGVPRDSMILDTALNVQQINFPFRIDENETSFVVRYDAIRRIFPQAPDDTISFSYVNVPQFQSESCGVFYRYDDVTIRHTTFMIDSVTCPDGYIDNTPSANIRIYFHNESTEE